MLQRCAPHSQFNVTLFCTDRLKDCIEGFAEVSPPQARRTLACGRLCTLGDWVRWKSPSLGNARPVDDFFPSLDSLGHACQMVFVMRDCVLGVCRVVCTVRVAHMPTTDTDVVVVEHLAVDEGSVVAVTALHRIHRMALDMFGVGGLVVALRDHDPVILKALYHKRFILKDMDIHTKKSQGAGRGCERDATWVKGSGLFAHQAQPPSQVFYFGSTSRKLSESFPPSVF